MKIKKAKSKNIVIADLPKQLRAIRDRIQKSRERISNASAVAIKPMHSKIQPRVVDEFAESYLAAKEDEKSAKEIADAANGSIKQIADHLGEDEIDDTGSRRIIQGSKYTAGYSIVQGQPQIDHAKAAKVLSDKELLAVSDLVIDKIKLENAIQIGKISMDKAKRFLKSPAPTKRIYIHLKK